MTLEQKINVLLTFSNLFIFVLVWGFLMEEILRSDL
jgi:hypothetical protein|tara:strand:+ start:3653 stop:3760 length:108 start_codon:yes stop_codon:yes gene_type:complete